MALRVSVVVGEERTADPSATLGMTKGRMELRFGVVVDAENCRSQLRWPDKGGVALRFSVVVGEIQIFAEHAGRSLRICSQRQLCAEDHGELQAEGKNVE